MNSENTVLQSVLTTVERHNMIDPGNKILAAVSGGADSVCMLHILNCLAKKLEITVFCAHLNHGLRGDAADRDENFVKNLCARLDIPFFSKKVDVAALAKKEKLSTEEAGRKARYDFFAQICEQNCIGKIATAHNKNDNAETVIMRILRGTGIDGLGGISYKREDGVIRPLLDVSRSEIEEYCAVNKLDFCTDATNAENDYTRNKIRNQLIPYLESEFNVKVTDSLSRLSENARDDAEFLNDYAERLYKRLKNPLPGNRPTALHIESLALVNKAVAARVLRLATEDEQPGVKPEKKHIEDVFDLMTKQTGASLDLPNGLKVFNQYGWIVFEGKEEAVRKAKAFGDTFFVAVAPGESVFVESLGKTISFRIEKANEYKCKANETAVNYDLVQGEQLFLRSRRDGDRIVWFADGRTKKIKNILIDDKIPQRDRNRIPLLCTGSEVLAIVGSRVSGKYKITDETEKALIIEYGSVE